MYLFIYVNKSISSKIFLHGAVGRVPTYTGKPIEHSSPTYHTYKDVDPTDQEYEHKINLILQQIRTDLLEDNSEAFTKKLSFTANVTPVKLSFDFSER